ncbi:MAG: hypothetical protein BWY76_01336 [bacterium ADurb.Bin429]|nr:MAG: hypothetical protein BWY76_01336 [bacterium ADurb.Bin429]
MPGVKGHRVPPGADVQRHDADAAPAAGRVTIPDLLAAAHRAPAPARHVLFQQHEVGVRPERCRRCADTAHRRGLRGGFAFRVNIGLERRAGQRIMLLFTRAHHHAGAARLPAFVQFQHQHILTFGDVAKVKFLGDGRQWATRRKLDAQHVFAARGETVAGFILEYRRAVADDGESLRTYFASGNQAGAAHPGTVGASPLAQRRGGFAGVNGFGEVLRRRRGQAKRQVFVFDLDYRVALRDGQRTVLARTVAF